MGEAGVSLGLAFKAPTPSQSHLPPPGLTLQPKGPSHCPYSWPGCPAPNLRSGQASCSSCTCQRRAGLPPKSSGPSRPQRQHWPRQLQPCSLVPVSGPLCTAPQPVHTRQVSCVLTWPAVGLPGCQIPGSQDVMSTQTGVWLAANYKCCAVFICKDFLCVPLGGTGGGPATLGSWIVSGREP